MGTEKAALSICLVNYNAVYDFKHARLYCQQLLNEEESRQEVLVSNRRLWQHCALRRIPRSDQ